MIPALKTCYVLLNRNCLDVGETSKQINYLPTVEIENYKASSCRNKISDLITSTSRNNEKYYSKLRNKDQLNYSNDMHYSESDDVDSEFCDDSSSSGDDETIKEQRKKIKYDLSKTIPKKLSCSFCNKSFSTHLSYLSHKRSHESKPFKCIVCGESYENRQSFLNHMKKIHPEVDPFVCNYPGCEQSFKTRKSLESHRKMHWKYMCKFCKKLFVKKYQMKKHIFNAH